jgi:hypothetical protein
MRALLFIAALYLLAGGIELNDIAAEEQRRRHETAESAGRAVALSMPCAVTICQKVFYHEPCRVYGCANYRITEERK